ncbi:hypothetical protein DSM106972_097390 [Dulcicalothrix desertica PCC 7102]|uniref:Uncharacterized protein n=1 Tax=Dulcicalothrix desertica PCC 7102 TaxID=232991 RepID=A0A3S1A3N7_9CYAN|nr:hypothetical protein [Dulcicalothrix desertica]RUS93145.1 hypothetical protein DSM106972_097390 [Dulcicalothrix desertica PCC 7102]TWH62796.1 hypothetical protein CAL7102_00324 [Dulcicalothrix desertica PCC 7102]
MKLEQQLEKLAELGLTLNEGVTVDDLLYSLPREAYEEKPFGYLLSIFGASVEREPWGRAVCARVWNFDTECIYQTGDYVNIVKRLCLVANKPDLITDIEDYVNIESEEAWLKYKINGKQRNFTIEVDNDWADTLTISYIMDDIESDGFHFYYIDNGQAMILFYLNETGAS